MIADRLVNPPRIRTPASMHRPIVFLLAALLLGPLAAPGLAAQETDARSTVEPELQQRINVAISRGTDSLLRQQEIDGSWKHHASGYPNGQTSLTIYTLLKCDAGADHPSIARAIAFLERQPPEKTYSTALQIMALCELDAERFEDEVEDLVALLESWQRGGYAYPDHEPDLSNTQYAALGLRAAAQHGHEVQDKTWQRLAEWTIKLQQKGAHGGFRYDKGRDHVTGSMTSAGIAVLSICEEQLPRAPRELRPALERGAQWLTRNFRVDQNPARLFDDDAARDQDGGHPYYYVYGLERVGALLGQSHFGEHDWYREGALWLLERQEEDGRWSNQAETCFALLFLARATGKQSYTGAGVSATARTYGGDSVDDAVSVRAAGRGPLRMWVSSFGKRAFDDHGWGADDDKHLRIERVEFRCEDPEAEGGSRVLGQTPAKPDVPGEDQRFAAKLDFPSSGTFRVFARVHLHSPAEVDSDASVLREVDSPFLKVDVLQVDSERLALYANDAAKNLLREARAKTETSSERNEQQGGDACLDGRIGSQWISAKDDPKPTLVVTLARAARGDLLLLTPATDDPGGVPPPNRTPENSPARIRKLRVTINGSKKSIEVEVASDPREKIEVPLGKTTKVTELRIEVLEVVPGGREDQGVGFAELELLVAKQRRKR